MGKYKYVFLDFDGTIADTMNESYQIYTELVERFKLNKLSYQECVGLRQLNSREAIKRLGLTNHFHTLLFFYRAKREQNKIIDKIKPFYQVTKFLESVKDKYHFIICTSNLKRNVTKFFKNNNINFITNILTCSTLFAKEKIILKYIKKKKININESLYIGDETRDIESCKKINLDIAAVCWGYHEKENLEKSLPSYLINDIADLQKVLI